MSVTNIKRFIGLYGKETKEKVVKLQELIEKAIEKEKIQSNDPNFSQIKTVQKAVFRHILTRIWKKIIGDPKKPFHVMIYGSGGKGKSTLGIKFAIYLSKELQRKVLNVADEEKISNILKDKFLLFNAYNQNLSVTGKIPNSLKE